MANGALKRREVWPSHDEVFASYRGRGPFVKWRDACFASTWITASPPTTAACA